MELHKAVRFLCSFVVLPHEERWKRRRGQPEWPSLCRDHRKKSEMLGADSKARDEAGEWKNVYQGHLLHELMCAGGSRWLDASDRKALRLTHGSQRLLMPQEAVSWDTSPRKEDPATLWEESSDEYEEEHNTLNRGLGLFTLQESNTRIQQCLKEEKVRKTALTCHFALDVIYMSMEW